MLMKGEDLFIPPKISLSLPCQIWENRVQETKSRKLSWNGKQGRLWWPIPLAAVPRLYSQERKRASLVEGSPLNPETGAERDEREENTLSE